MSRFGSFSRALVLAIAAFAFATTQAHATLYIRTTEYDSTGTQIGQHVTAPVAFVPPTGSILDSFSLGAFTISVVNNLVTSTDGTTHHSEVINMHYAGGTGGSSERLVVEFLGSSYVSPPSSPPNAFVTSNASPSTSGLAASSVAMYSGVTSLTSLGAGAVTFATVSANVDSPASSLTTGIGSMGSSSSVLLPNPANSPGFSLTAPFNFYQALTFSGFTNSGLDGSISAGSSISNTPEPSSIALAAAGLPILGLVWARRRRQQV